MLVRGLTTAAMVGHTLFSLAATWLVTSDPDDPSDRIGSVVGQASSGDTVLVGPGTYYEHIVVMGKALVLKSTDGMAATILDGSEILPEREGAILYSAGERTYDLRIEGFTFRKGRGASDDIYGQANGGAIKWASRFGGGTAEFRSCSFEDNVASDGLYGNGGALFVSTVDEMAIIGCKFSGNLCRWDGGAVYVSGDKGASFLMTGCEMEVEPTGLFGAGIYLIGPVQATIEESHFTGFADHGRRAIRTAVADLRIRSNSFIDFGGTLATGMEIYTPGIEGPPNYVEISENLFWNGSSNVGTGGTSISISLGEGGCTIARNSFVHCGFDAAVVYGTIECSNNILYEAKGGFYTLVGGTISCNDAWPNALTMPTDGSFVFEGNISADPLFCDPDAGDFSLAFQSPCTEPNAPDGCGLIGLLGPACREDTPVEKSSWGAIKARFKK